MLEQIGLLGLSFNGMSLDVFLLLNQFAISFKEMFCLL